MGGVLSKGKSATPAVSAGSAPAPTDGKTPLLERQGARTAENGWTEADQRIDKLQTEGSAATSAVDKHAKEHSELPPDMQFILESGLHEEPADERSSSKGQQGSIQDAVNDIKAKYNLNQPVATGELERIRKEIELKIRLMAMREAAQQRRMAAQAASTSNAAEPSQQEQLYKVDVKGKGRADQEDDESSSSEDDESSSSGEESDSGSSSSSGSSIGFKAPARKVKQQRKPDDSDVGESDDDLEAGKLKPEEIAQAAAAFASQHEVVNPTIPPPPVDTIPADAPLRPIGRIDHIINSVIVIRADINTQESMKGQILDEGSLLCLGDRRVLGAIFETFGPVHAPYYSIRLPPGHQLVVKTATSDGAESEPVEAGMQVFYSPTPDFSGLLFTRDIQQSQMKGSDASNLYDEEVGENEIEFSDDEQEVAYRRDLKQRKKERWAERQQDAHADNAEFEFDEDFDDVASVRSAVQVSQDSIQNQESEEEGAIFEVTGGHKRKLSSSTGSTQGGNQNKLPRSDGPPSSQRGRGARPERGRGGGRGRAAHTGNSNLRGGRGSGRGGMERGRGRGQGRGAGRGAVSSRGHSTMPHGASSRQIYHHPDALPYDDAPIAPFQQQRSISPVRPHHSLPPRPITSIEPYDPSIPQGHSAHPPRGMNALAQPWSPQAAYTSDHVPYVPMAPYSPPPPISQQYPQPTYNNSFAYHPTLHQQAGQYQPGGFGAMGISPPIVSYNPNLRSNNFDPANRRDNDASGR